MLHQHRSRLACAAAVATLLLALAWLWRATDATAHVSVTFFLGALRNASADAAASAAAAAALADIDDYAVAHAASVSDRPPSVAFLFLTLDGSVSWPEVWALFFGAAPDTGLFSVWVHRSDGKSSLRDGVPPRAAEFEAACRGRLRAAPFARNTAWGQLIGAQRSLASAALAGDPFAVQFVILSDSAVPVKSFTHVHDALAARGPRASAFCTTGQASWHRSLDDGPDVVFPKHTQWVVLSRAGAARLEAVDAAAEVDAACGGSWRDGCRPATSEELMFGPILGGVPAHEMGASWLRAHPVFRTEREDKALARALAIDDRLATAAADASSSSSSSTSSASSASFSTTNGAGGAAAAAARPRGAPANGSFPVPGLLGGRLHLVDVGATRFGSCDTFDWWDDLRTDASKEPAWAPFELAATALAAGDRGTASEPCGTTRGGGGACRPPEPVPAFVDDASREAAVRAVLDPHVDRCWAPRYHPQRFGPEAMTAQFLHHGLCASKFLFARKFDASFTLRPKPWDGDPAAPCSWNVSSGASSLSGLACTGGLRPSPLCSPGGARACAKLCCAMGRGACAAWQFRGRDGGCWVGRAAEGCVKTAWSSSWRGAAFAQSSAAGAAARLKTDAARERARVVDAFAACFAMSDDHAK